MNTQTGESFSRLVKIMDELREQCPWDRKQTIETLRQMTIEETYELADEITHKNWDGIREELGDLLLHIVFYARIGTEQKKFTLDEVIHGICDKLIARHPHVYGNVKVKDEEDVKKNWENLKLKEGKKSILEGVPRSLPALIKAMRLQEKAKQVGFEWENKEQVWEKVEEEIGELQEALRPFDKLRAAQAQGPGSLQLSVNSPQSASSTSSDTGGSLGVDELQDKVEEEFGDLMFSMINYARFLQIDAENALERTNHKFILRFRKMEDQALQQGRDLKQMSLQEMDALWNSVKRQ